MTHRQIFDLFARKDVEFDFQDSDPIIKGPLAGEHNVTGRSALFPTAMLQLIGDADNLRAVSAWLTMGGTALHMQQAAMVAVSLARLIEGMGDDRRVSQWVLGAFNAVKPKLSSRRERVFEIGGELIRCEAVYTSMYRQNKTGAFIFTAYTGE